MRYIKLIIILVVAFSFVVSESYAQEASTTPVSGRGSARMSRWQHSLGKIKNDISKLLEENNKLDSQYKSLKKEIVDLQNSINGLKVENSEINDEIQRTKKVIIKQKNTQANLLQKEEKLKNNIVEQQSRSASLDDEIADLDQTVNLWKLQIEELETRKKELMLELKLQEDKQKGIDQGESNVINNLKKDLTDIQDEQVRVQKKITELSKQKMMIKEDIEKKKQENKNLEEQIAKLRSQKKNKSQSNVSLQRKSAKTSKEIERQYPERLREKRNLETKIKSLENQLEKVKREIEGSLELQENKRNYINKIMVLDEENQALRDKISDLNQRIAALKAQAASME